MEFARRRMIDRVRLTNQDRILDSMKNTCITATVAALLAAALIPSLNAREVDLWAYDRLEHEADLVVIGIAEKSEDSGEVVHAQLWQTDFIGVNTTFTITGVLDGRFRENELVVHTLRLPNDKILNEGPKMVSFQTRSTVPGLSTRISRQRVPEYMLFLKKRKDGRYEPVSGSLDALHSVREVTVPSSAK